MLFDELQQAAAPGVTSICCMACSHLLSGLFRGSYEQETVGTCVVKADMAFVWGFCASLCWFLHCSSFQSKNNLSTCNRQFSKLLVFCFQVQLTLSVVLLLMIVQIAWLTVSNWGFVASQLFVSPGYMSL